MKTKTRRIAFGEAFGRGMWSLARAAGKAMGVRGQGSLLRGSGAAVVAGLMAMAASSTVIAGPEGQQVVVGNVTFTRQGNLWVITASNGAIINYASFDLLPYETVRFIQPNQLSTVLNRINSAAPTRIDGRIEANGNVFFVNPAGVIFGAGATVNVGGLYAAAGHISNEDFTAGNLRFTGLQGRVENSGNITANAVAMVGREAANHGTIIAQGGSVVMAAGQEVFIGRNGSSVYTQIQGGASTQNGAAVQNTGTIKSAGGQVLMSAGDADGMAIFNSGLIQASTIGLEGQGTGSVIVGGTLDASNAGGRGGDIAVTGQDVGLFGATVDASGTTGGGTIKIGGDAGGQGDTRRSDHVFVDRASVVRADAYDSGDGGRITFWGTNAMRLAGAVSARGGVNGGDGGFIETSGGYIAVVSTPELYARSAGAKGGTWVIDPNNITIVAGGGNTNINAADPFASTDDGSQLGVDLITTALGNGASVSITTATGGANSEAGVITLATNLSYTGTGTATLTLNAHSDIVFSSGVSVTGTGAGGLNLVLNADSDNNGSGSVNLNNATLSLLGGSLTVSANVEDFTLAAGGSITTGGGNATFNNTGVNSFGGAINLGAGAFTAATSGVTTLSGTLTASSVSIAGITAINGGSVTTAGGTQTYTGAVTLGANTTLTGTTITFGSTVDSSGAARSLTVNGAAAFNGDVGSLLQLSSLTVTGATTLTNADVTTSGTQTYGAAVSIGGSATTLTGGNMLFQGTLDTTVDLTLASTADVSVTGVATLGGDTTVNGVNISFTNVLRTDVGGDGVRNLTLNGSGVTSLFQGVSAASRRFATFTSDAAGSAIILGPITTTGNIDVLDGSVTLTSVATSVTSTGGDVTFGGNLVLGADVVFSGNNVTFSGTINDDAAATQRTLTVNSAGTTTFGGSIGATRALAALVTDAGGTTLIGGNITTAGAQTYGDAVELTGDVTLAGVGLTFSSTVDSNGAGRALTINDSGTTTFTGAVGGGLALSSLSTNAGGGTVFNASVTTSGAQTYLDAVTLGADLTMTGAGIRFGSTLNSTGANRALTISDSGLTRFDAAVGGILELASLTVAGGGTTQIAANISTTGAQQYDNNTTVTADATLASSAGLITLNGTFDAGAAGVDLTLNAANGVTVNGNMGAGTAFGSLTFSGGTTSLVGNITTTGAQTYSSAVIVAGPTVTLTSTGSGDISFASTIDADIVNRGLTVNTSGVTTFTGAIGGGVPLDSITTDAGGSVVIGSTVHVDGNATFNDSAISLGGNVTATNATFGGALTLTADATIDVVNVTFSSTVDADLEANNRVLVVALQPGGQASFQGAVGGGQRLSTLTVTDGGAALTILAANVSTVGAQQYDTAVQVAADITLAADANITFGASVDADAAASNRALTIATTNGSTTTFTGAVGSSQSLGSLSVSDTGAGTTVIGNSITTSGAQTFDEAVQFTGDATLQSTGGAAITFNSTIESDATPRNLTVDTTGAITFTGAVGATNALASLTTLNGAVTISGGVVKTTTLQSYGSTVTLTADTVLTSDEIDFAGNVTGTGFALGLDTFNGATGIELGGAGGTGAMDLTSAELAFLQDGFTSLTFGGAGMIGNINVASALTFTDAVTFLANPIGTTTLGFDVNTGTNALTFDSLVTLAADVTLTGSTVRFTQAVDGGQALTVAGDAQFDSAVGSNTALTSLSVSGATTINGASIETTGAQTYSGLVSLGTDVNLTGSLITFSASAESVTTAHSLTVTGDALFSAAFGGGAIGLQDLTVTGAATIDGGSVTTIGRQTYGGTVALGASTTLTGAQVRFTGDVTAADPLTQTLTIAGITEIAGNLSMTAARYAFNGDLISVGGNQNLTLTASQATSSINQPLFVFGGNVGGTVLGGADAFNILTFAAPTLPGGFASAAYSTIMFANSTPFTGSTSTLTADTILFGAGHRLAAMDNLTINSTNLTVGDISTAGDLTINSTNITVRLRDGGTSVVSGGQTNTGNDEGCDWVALGNVIANGTLTLDDGGNPARTFVIAAGAGKSISGTATAGQVTTNLGINSSVASAIFAPGGGNLALDLTSDTSFEQPPIAGLNPKIEIEAVATPQPISGELALFMRSYLDLEIKDESPLDQMLDSLIGRAIYEDMATFEPGSTQARYRVSRERLTTEYISRLRDTYRSVFQKENGVDDRGLTLYVDDPAVPATIGAAWKKYKAQATRADGKGFRAFVESDGESAEALRILDGVRDLMGQLDRLGLSEFEARKPKEVVIGRLLSSDTGTNAAAQKIMMDAVIGDQVGAPAEPMAMLVR